MPVVCKAIRKINAGYFDNYKLQNLFLFIYLLDEKECLNF